jgi:hypothetical protein
MAAPSHPLLLGILGRDDLCWAAAVVSTHDARRFLSYARERQSLIAPLAFLKQEFPLAFEPSLEEDLDWAAFRRLPGLI